ncbi:MAG: hypothetical protein KGI54_14990 [Pseudomonadota bacterium]|nr:hypothetical protein [Pseudomonadota bacterium]
MTEESTSALKSNVAERPLTSAQFAKSLKGTHEEVWMRLISGSHGRENHTPTEWRSLLNNHKTEPAFKK